MDQCEYLCSLSMARWCYVGGMEWGLFSTRRDAYGHIYIYMVYLFFICHLHCISFIALAYGVMSRTYGSDRTGITSFIEHNNAASYLVGYVLAPTSVTIRKQRWHPQTPIGVAGISWTTNKSASARNTAVAFYPGVYRGVIYIFAEKAVNEEI